VVYRSPVHLVGRDHWRRDRQTVSDCSDFCATAIGPLHRSPQRQRAALRATGGVWACARQRRDRGARGSIASCANAGAVMRPVSCSRTRFDGSARLVWSCGGSALSRPAGPASSPRVVAPWQASSTYPFRRVRRSARRGGSWRGVGGSARSPTALTSRLIRSMRDVLSRVAKIWRQRLGELSVAFLNRLSVPSRGNTSRSPPARRWYARAAWSARSRSA
jgi:hypothetical protein